MSELKEICIYIFRHSFYKNLFQNEKRKKNEEIIEKEYGNIIKSKIKGIQDLDGNNLIKELNFSFIGYKYPDLNNQNIKQIVLDVFNLIKLSSNKKNIIIKFEKSFIKEFNTLLNRLETDKPFILFNFEEQNIFYQNNLFNNFTNPQYISYKKMILKNIIVKLLLYFRKKLLL